MQRRRAGTQDREEQRRKKTKIKNRIKIKSRTNNQTKTESSSDGTSAVENTRAWRLWWLGVLVGMVLVIVLDQAAASWAAGSGGIEDVKSFAMKLTSATAPQRAARQPVLVGVCSWIPGLEGSSRDRVRRL